MQKQQYNANVLNTDRIAWLLTKLAVPAFLGMFVQTMYNVVNTIFVGQFVGPLGIAGLSIVFPLQMFAMGLSMMVSVGGISVISRLLGTGDESGAERTLGNGITVSIVLSVVVVIVVLPFTDFWRFYQALMDRVIAINCAIHSGVFTFGTDKELDQHSGRLEKLRELEKLDAQKAEIANKLKKEKHMGKQVELNTRIKK